MALTEPAGDFNGVPPPSELKAESSEEERLRQAAAAERPELWAWPHKDGEPVEPNSSNCKARHAQWVRECRNVSTFPPVLLNKLRQPGGKRELFRDWYEAIGDWCRVKMIQRRKIEHKIRCSDVWGFKMRHEIVEMYKGDEVFVNTLLAKKLKDGLWKRNPESPEREDHILWYVRLETTVAKEKCEGWELELLSEADIDSDMAAKMAAPGGVFSLGHQDITGLNEQASAAALSCMEEKPNQDPVGKGKNKGKGKGECDNIYEPPPPDGNNGFVNCCLCLFCVEYTACVFQHV